MVQDLLDRHTSAIDRCQRQNQLTIPKLLLSTLAIISPYGRHLTKCYTVAPKWIFLISPLLLLQWTHSAIFSQIKFPSFTLPSPLTHARICWILLIPARSKNITCVTDDEVRHLVLFAPCKPSDLDPMPTSLAKDCIYILITPIASIINLLFTECSLSSHFKFALVSPLLKKSTLNKDSTKNYRPVSNHSFLLQIFWENCGE